MRVVTMFRALSLVLVLSSPAILLAQTPAVTPTMTQPVAPEEVRGTRLIPADEAFSIEAPDGWQWMKTSRPAQGNAESKTYVAMSPDRKNSFTVTVLRDQTGAAVDDAYMESIGGGLQGEQSQGTWRISDFRFEATKVPISPAFRYSCRAVNRNTGEIRYRFGTIAGSAVKYHFMSATDQSTAPAEFEQFVSSFRDAS
jgi:hypothetical protein